MAVVVETPLSFGARAGEAIITLRVSPTVRVGTVAERARAIVDVAFARDDGRARPNEIVHIALAPEGSAVPVDAAAVIAGADQAAVNAFLQVAQLIFDTAVTVAEAPKE